MSDTDSFFSENEISTDLEISIDRELIAVVRVNRFLYDKLYANSNVKTEAWTQIGASLSHPLEEEADAVNKSLIEQSKGLTDLATKIGQAIMTPPPPPSALSAANNNASAGVQPMLSALEFALSRVPEHAQLQCLITLLQYINDFSKT